MSRDSVNASESEAGEVANAPRVPSRRRAAWPTWVVAIFFAVLYSYALWAGVGNAVGLPQAVWANYHLGVSVLGWVLLVIGIVLSPLVYAACLLLGRRRSLIAKTLIYVAGLCVVSAVLGSLIVAPTLVNFIA